MSKQQISLVTRRSEMARAQSQTVASALEQVVEGISVELLPVDSVADVKRDTNSLEARDKIDWISGLQDSIVSGAADVAIHSAKDVPVEVASETELLPVLRRSSPRDALVFADPKFGERAASLGSAQLFEQLFGSTTKIGTSSFRREAISRYLNPDLEVVPIRGNVNTRISKLKAGKQFDALILAEAGLERLGFEEAYVSLDDEVFLPAVNQGILVAQFHKERSDIKQQLLCLRDEETYVQWKVERRVIELLGADCHSAVAVFAAVLGEGRYSLRAEVYSYDAETRIEADIDFQQADAEAAAKSVGNRLLELGAATLLDCSRELGARR